MTPRRATQEGFSLVEVLVAAFVLAIGILGLTMLQVFAIRTNTSSGSMTKALAIANRTLETIALEGRRSMLWKTEGRTPKVSTTTFLGTAPVTRFITTSGKVFTSETAAVATGEMVFTVNVVPSEVMVARGTVMVGSISTPVDVGFSSLFSVDVRFLDQVVTTGGATKSINRTVRLARRISHA